MLVLLLITLLPACENPRTPDKQGLEPVPEAGLPAASSLPATRQQDKKVSPATEMRQSDVLDLRLRERPETEPSSPVLGAVPDSGWLDPGPGVTGTDSGQNRLLPDLFDGKQRDKPLSVKGRMRFGDDAEDLSGTLDGAEMSIEIKTD